MFMATQRKNSTGNKEKQPRHVAQTASPVSRTGRFHRFRPNRRLCLTISGYLLAIGLCGLAGYLWRAPLPTLTVPAIAEAASVSSVMAGRTGSKGALERCLRQVKKRDLFKPSVPIPSDGGIGKSTAQELAERMQFVGTMQESDGLAALVFIPNRGPGTFRVGDRVAEFVLKDVQSNRLTLELGEEQAILKR